MILIKALLILAILSGCASQTEKASNQYNANENRPIVDNKYSLTADREAFAKLREQIPPETQVENDELALLDSLFSDPNRDPSEIKNSFDRKIQKKRELFERDSRKEREVFTKSERKTRDEFLKNQKQNRDEQKKNKLSAEKRKEFFSQLEERRLNFFQNEREKRSDFESDLRERRKSFDDYLRERQATFTQKWRAFKSNQEQSRKGK